MASEKRLRIKTLIMVLAMVVCAVTGDLLLKRGMSEAGAVQFNGPGLGQALLHMTTSGMIWLGILFLLGFMASQMTVMSWADYSYVMPAGAFGYALQTFLAVAVLHELGIDPSKVNVNGGAVALGHAIGSSGGRVLTTLLYAMKRRNARRGIATLCLGGGNGVALAVERESEK